MGIFTRFRDIINSNINAMLDKAEDPEKLIKLMIREMEDTLVEIKAACAGVIARSKKTGRHLEEVLSRAGVWEERAGLAVTKGRDDLAREALLEKRKFAERADTLDKGIDGTGCPGQTVIGTTFSSSRTSSPRQRKSSGSWCSATSMPRASDEPRKASGNSKAPTPWSSSMNWKTVSSAWRPRPTWSTSANSRRWETEFETLHGG